MSSFKAGIIAYGAFQVVLEVKNMPANAGDIRDKKRVRSLGQEDPLEEGMATHSMPGESHGQRSLTGYSPQGPKESDTTEVT